MSSHTLPEVLRHERDLAFHVQDSSEVREKAQDILNKLSEDHYINLAIHQPILHRVTVAATRFLSSPSLAPGRSSSDHNQSNTALVPGVALASNDGTAVPCPGLYLLDDAHATAYSYGPSMATGFIVLHSSLLGNLDLEETTFTSTTNPHLVAFIIAHELGHLLLCHHLESISQILFYPSLGAILVDFLHSLLYPFFVMFGPFVEEGMRSMGRVSISEGKELVHLCFSRTMEIEADTIALRSVLAKNKIRRRVGATHYQIFTQVIGPGRFRSYRRFRVMGE